MSLVLDVQGFKTSQKIFQPKELAAYDGIHVSHYIFKPPFPLHTLPHDLQQQAKWLMHNHHCINWMEGYTPIHSFKDIMQRLTKNVDVVYVKGSEKANYLRTFTDKRVVEFDEQPALSPSIPSCMYHSHSPCMCALSNVYHLYNNYVMQ